MNWQRSIAFLISSFILLGCGSKSSSGTVPSPVDPSVSAPSPIPSPDTNTSDSRLPDLTSAVNINLTDKVGFTGLTAISENVFPPLVGDPKMVLKLTNTRSMNIEGSVLLAYEDQIGFWGAQLPSFPGTSVHNATNVDAIFADSALVIRVIGNILSDTTTGNIYYRLRKSDETACIQVQTSCYDSMGYPSNACTITTPDTVTPCRAYMNTSSSEVKLLGAFTGPYTQFAILPETK